jgi:murein DD-endopeptidase MepM/ murein hydrolase activator NlpD
VEPRTFKIDDPHMHGADIEAWQREVKTQFSRMAIAYPLKDDGIYGVGTRSATATLLHALGMNAAEQMRNGVTPELRSRVRNRRLTLTERLTKAARVGFRRQLRIRFHAGGTAAPTAKIIADSWGYHLGVHDGLDVICVPAAPIFAMVKAKVVDVRASGWWGLGAPTNPTLKAKGDGIIQLEVLENIGPFRKGMHIGYGHAEGAVVHVGQEVQAGQHIGHAGFAVAWHIHLMINDGGTMKGVGTRDPRPYLDYAVKHA